MDPGALDDLNLDDMFAEDGDLFEGLDIQMEGMGEIITTSKKDSRRGPRTKRPPPVDEDEQNEEEEETTLKRRKTKRKTKTPIAFGDDDDDYLEDTHHKKKARKNKLSSTAPPPAPIPSAAKKAKKATGKTKKPSMIPPPSDARANSSVAAAGRFGQRGTATKLTKRKSTATEETALPPAPPAFVPKHESTYGGLPPSKTQFYPFIESVPPEPNLKSRKQYPQIDKVFAAFNGYMSIGGPGKDGFPVPSKSPALDGDLTMESPIMQLLIESFEAVSEKDKAAFGDLKKQSMLTCIPQVRHVIQNTDPVKLLPDLYTMCGLLTRQYNFVKTSLTNMEMWCKDEFSDSDFCQAFSLPEPFHPEKVGTTIASSNRKWKKPIINVKISFLGNKEVKGGPVLQARMPSTLVVNGEKKKIEGTGSTKAKVNVAGAVTTAKKSSSSVPPKASIPKTYPDLSPVERRQLILDRVAQVALGLESQLNFRRTKRPLLPTSSSNAAGDTKRATLGPSYVPPEEPLLHTARMWEWLEAAGFFQASLASESPSLKHARVGLQSPEIFPRGILLPTAKRIQGRNAKGKEDDLQVSGHGLYDRLQSLLVVVEGDAQSMGTRDDRTMDDDSADSSETDDESMEFLDESDEEEHDFNSPNRSRVDLSLLSLEERTFLHLSSIGLIKKPIFPKVELVLDEDEDGIEDDLVDVIGEMSADLSTLTARNNARIRYLETAMDPMNLAYRKQVEEEQASLISRCQSLLKRSKEKTKKSNKQKSAVASSKDDLNLPW
jgi:hypothetical protein